MTLSARIAYNTIIQIAGKIISTALGLIAVAIMTRHLGTLGFGQYTTIITFLSFFGIIADLGLTLITTQMISLPGVNQDKILSNLFGLRAASAVFFLGLAPLIVFFFPYELPIKLGVAVVTLAFFFNALNQILVGLFQKSLRMDKVSIAEIAGRIVLIGGIIAAIKLKSGLMGIMVTTVISGAINFLSNYLFSLKFARIKLAFDKDVWLQIVKKIWPLAITITLNLIYLKADTLILSLIKSQSEVGIYGAAYKVIDVFTAIPFMFAGVVLPIITFAWAENRERFKNIFQKSFDATVILALPIVIGAQFTAERVMTLVAGKEFAAAGPVLKILIMAAGIIFLGSMFAHAIIAIDRQRKIIGAYVFTSITAFFGYLFFIPTYSFFGAAWVTVYSELAIALASVFIFWKYAKFLPNFKIFLKSFLASLLMGATLYFLPSFNLFLTLAAAIIIYAGALYLFKGLKFVSFDSNYNS